MNDRGQGRGRLGEASAVHITEAGVLQIESTRPASVELEDLVRVQ
jgi:hypothetical protein